MIREMFEKCTYEQRRAELKKMMGNGIGLFLGNAESPINYADNTYVFRQDSTFLYFFGIRKPNLAAIIDFESGEEMVFGDEADIDDIIWTGPQPTIADYATLCGVGMTYPLRKLGDVLKVAVSRGRKVHYLPPYRADNILQIEHLLGIHSSKVGEESSMQLIKSVIDLRATKSDEEIEEIEKACEIGYDMHVSAMHMVKSALNESQIHSVVDSIPLKYGGRLSFATILSQDGQTLHNHSHNLPIQPGRLMLVDAGAETAMGYASDFTRTFPVSGKFTQMQKEIYQIVLDTNDRALELARPGVTYQSVHLQCCKVIASGLKNLGLMKGDVDEAVASGAHALFLPHGLGHMMGLDVHDMENLGQIYVGYNNETRPIDQFGTSSLRMGRKLEPGFVVTDEPGIYFIPELVAKWKREHTNEQFINFSKVEQYLGFGGIRIEDDLLITANGARRLGRKRVPAKIEDVENEIAKG